MLTAGLDVQLAGVLAMIPVLAFVVPVVIFVVVVQDFVAVVPQEVVQVAVLPVRAHAMETVCIQHQILSEVEAILSKKLNN